MSTPIRRNPVTVLWEIISASGLASSPHVAVEQIACLITIKYLEHLGHEALWSSLLEKRDPAAFLVKDGFPALRRAETDTSQSVIRVDPNGLFNDAYFQLETTKPEALIRLLEAVDELFFFGESEVSSRPSAGDAFDELLSIAAVGGNSLNTTPRALSRFVVALLDPTVGKRWIDPAVGTARLLLDAEHYVSGMGGQVPKTPAGVDVDKSVARIGWVNLLLHDLDPVPLHVGNSIAGAKESTMKLSRLLHRGHYDFVMSDLPFGTIGDRVQDDKANFLPSHTLNEKEKLIQRMELLFIWRSLDLLVVGGRAALVIPQSVLYGTAKEQRRLRQELMTQQIVEGVILLPEWMPQQSNPMALLLFKKTVSSAATYDTSSGSRPRTTSIWFYEIGAEHSSASGDDDFYDALVHYRRQLQGHELESEYYYQPALDDDQSSEHVSLHTSDLDADVAYRQMMRFLRRPAARTKQWRIPVREWIHNPEWRDAEGRTVGSHDSDHQVRPEYEAFHESHLYVNQELKPGLLEPGCIEARRWSLDINDYRWPEAPLASEGTSALELIDELVGIEKDILNRLESLRSLLAGEDR
ncbi:SAM-dependent methyltransferase [Pseudomonas sp. 13B_2.1_Bac1]|uniref:HsdM family class I SAM-dependent methyltransferase n=1 Tax=Pseudomonas sp. 13B_2.1_Bac1 TaxID=2971624 RepID=UPI0021C79D32|nr:SAM-dependent methyltransferase [Pseudomonas sp. 13B_2.1_Bac1]MCU1783668.1 SAM-dependent methyltransferase [Pseudomonas sp. 13B_2.1_Bac1]